MEWIIIKKKMNTNYQLKHNITQLNFLYTNIFWMSNNVTLFQRF